MRFRSSARTTACGRLPGFLISWCLPSRPLPVHVSHDRESQQQSEMASGRHEAVERKMLEFGKNGLLQCFAQLARPLDWNLLPATWHLSFIGVGSADRVRRRRAKAIQANQHPTLTSADYSMVQASVHSCDSQLRSRLPCVSSTEVLGRHAELLRTPPWQPTSCQCPWLLRSAPTRRAPLLLGSWQNRSVSGGCDSEQQQLCHDGGRREPAEAPMRRLRSKKCAAPHRST